MRHLVLILICLLALFTFLNVGRSAIDASEQIAPRTYRR